MHFKFWTSGLILATALGATLGLSACGGGSSDNKTTQLRLLNASAAYSSLDLSVNSANLNTNVAYGSVGSYGSVNTSATASEVQTNGVGAVVASLTPTLSAGSNYTLIAYGWSGAVHTSLLQEAEAAADSNKSKLLVLNLAPDAGALDVYVSAANNSEDLSNFTPVAANIGGGYSSGYNNLNSGSFRVTLTGAGQPKDIRLDIPSLTLDSTGVSSLIVTASVGGHLVNAMHLKQQGAVTHMPNALARVRLAATLSGNPQVSAKLGASSVLPSLVAPQVGQYQGYTAGAQDLSLVVNGSPVSVSSPTLKAGGDYTLLVWGTPSAPQLSVLSDDNHLPTSSSIAKIRMINGLASGAAGLNLTLDYSTLASNVLPGTVSALSSVPASSSSLLTVSSPSSSTPVFGASGLAVPQGAVFSLFMMGDPASPVGQLVRDDR
ncbi:DUF4397 domain-containing protein [Paucibacter sp. Y2R2-4]|uniref:DUF4397 domain-containing protein n=1 Tax=Paucibacter sp. Y2R2-4 TaxID=2893553 RepID=UPI0021E3EDF8|nr:DUF4397 domain-containing protein [Paucibacter sp. Y2R2-4]MCV2350496.1 DUF4397 domain-containing protein [Paucibacter sp. Y2R2-4]